jgi:hypothetical protein
MHWRASIAHLVHGVVPEHNNRPISAIVNRGIGGSNLRFSLLALCTGNRNVTSPPRWWGRFSQVVFFRRQELAQGLVLRHLGIG